MRRPVKNYDFMLLDTWEYCFTHYWPVLLAGLISSIFLGAAMVRFLQTSPACEGFESYLLETTGIGGTMPVVFFNLLFFYGLILFLLYRWVSWRIRLKINAFIDLYDVCEQDFTKIRQGITDNSKAIFLEYMEYRSVLRAKEIILLNKYKLGRLNADDELRSEAESKLKRD